MGQLKSKFIGDKAFYKMVLAVIIPIIVQNGITNFVSLLDNIMVGRVGTEAMSGVAIANQLLFVYYLCVFGGVGGAGIFTAQYFGQGDMEGVRKTFRYKFWMSLILTTMSVLLFFFAGDLLIQKFLTGEDGDLALALTSGGGYLRVMLLGLPAFAIQQIYSGTLRECGETVVPMKAGIVAVFVNLLFNYLLIYGKFGFPVMGVLGAAIATVLSRYVELAIILVWTHHHTEKMIFAQNLYATLKVPGDLAWKMFWKGLPLLVNETLWAAGMSLLVQCYSQRGLNVVAGLNIANTINNLFNIVFIAMGDAVAILVGQLLGAGKMEEARDMDNKIICFSLMLVVCVAALMLLTAPFFPLVYKTTDEARKIATYFIIAQAVFMPQNAFMHAAYFTLRSGGQTIITFLFDSVFVMCISVPLAYCLIHFTGLYIIAVFACVQIADWIKCIIGFVLVKKGVWMRNLVEE